MIRFVIYEETDEFLTYEMNRLVKYHAIHNDFPEYNNVSRLIEGVRYNSPVFKDTSLLETGDNEMVPYRELFFTINHKGDDVTIVLSHLLVGNDDIFEGTLLIVVGLLLLIAVTFLLMIKHVSGRIWRPFYQTLQKITSFRITEPVPTFSQTGIDEFNTLNTTVEALLNKIVHDYKRTKEFNENASHELQTHLAVIRSSVEMLLNEKMFDEQNYGKLKAIHSAFVKLSQTQRSLLLLSKIGNQEYSNVVLVNFDNTIRQSLDFFREAIELRGISLQCKISECKLRVDGGLAEILVTNLLKNAVKYNVEGGYFSIELNQQQLIIKNSGLPYGGNPADLLERFQKGSQGNLGIGLAIVKQICDLYHFSITYHIDDSNHSIQIKFSE
ncbi:MAG: HAMP domain-containing sensor histidine kinase [Tenuifilaceae bacterium]|jgi:signal transduction histidine kinase|nr:HAMP domain-containing sensor histidine kinase [Tenuifilaceae bacterium]